MCVCVWGGGGGGIIFAPEKYDNLGNHKASRKTKRLTIELHLYDVSDFRFNYC